MLTETALAIERSVVSLHAEVTSDYEDPIDFQEINSQTQMLAFLHCDRNGRAYYDHPLPLQVFQRYYAERKSFQCPKCMQEYYVAEIKEQVILSLFRAKDTSDENIYQDPSLYQVPSCGGNAKVAFLFTPSELKEMVAQRRNFGQRLSTAVTGDEAVAPRAKSNRSSSKLDLFLSWLSSTCGHCFPAD